MICDHSSDPSHLTYTDSTTTPSRPPSPQRENTAISAMSAVWNVHSTVPLTSAYIFW